MPKIKAIREMYLIYTKKEWLSEKLIFRWTEKEIDDADEKGLIGRKFGIDCYITRPVPASPNTPTKQ